MHEKKSSLGFKHVEKEIIHKKMFLHMKQKHKIFFFTCFHRWKNTKFSYRKKMSSQVKTFE